MDWAEEFDSHRSLTELLQWGLEELGPTWASSLDAVAVADVYRSLKGAGLDPWPALGFELHMPCRPDERARVDFCLMSWERPGVLASPAHWAFNDALAPLRVAPTHRFLEFDSQGSDIRYMGEFFGVTEASAAAMPQGLLRDMHRVLGRAPATAALVEGRGGRWPAAFFPIKTSDEWTRMTETVAAAGMVVASPEQFAAVQNLQNAAKSVNVALVVDESSHPLPFVGFEFFGLEASVETRAALAKAGAPVAAIAAFEDLQRRLPRINTVSRPIVFGAALEVPWQHRFLQFSHAKINFRPEGMSLKCYLRLDTSAPGAFTGAGFAASSLGAAARAELRRSLRTGIETTSEPIDDLRSACPYFEIALPIVRGLWNDAMARVPATDLPLFSLTARDAVVSAGILRLNQVLAAGLSVAAQPTRSPGQQLIQELGIGDVETLGPTPEQIARMTRQVLSGDASAGVMEHVYGVALPVAADWIEGWREVAARVAADREELSQCFGISPDAPLVRVQTDAGDRHAGGRTVHLLWFAQGQAEIGVVYKPRDLRPDAAWYRLAEELMTALGEPHCDWPSVLVREGYGYAALVASGAPADSRAYSRNAGRVLALLHLCDGRDVHADNVIQTVAGPVPIDLECLWAGAEDYRMAPEGVPLGSVAATGFLPHWVRTARGIWRNGGGVLSSVPPEEDGGTNRHSPTGAPALPDAETFRIGFEEMYRLAMTEAGLHALNRCSRSCLGATRRRLLRATRVYGVLLQELGEAAVGLAGHEAKLREIRYRLGQTFGEKPQGDAVVNEEIASLSRGDIPRFTAVITASDIARRADETDLAWQLELLEVWSADREGGVPSADKQLAVGWHVAPDGAKGWWGWEGPAASAVRQLGWLPWTLYAGALGPLLAMAVAQRVGKGSAAETILSKALPTYRDATLRALQQSRAFRWGLEGLSGHLRAVEALLALGVDDRGSLEMVRQAWLAAALAADPADVKLDFTTGLAGAIGPLCRWAEQSQDEAPLELVARLAAVLLRRAPEMPTDPSLAHGRAGVGLGLLEAGALLGRDEWVGAALALWTNPSPPESPSLRTAWCRGYAGIALSRWVALQRLPHHSQAGQWRQVLSESRPILQDAVRNMAACSGALSLCCGSLGTVATLRVLGAAPSPADWNSVALAMAARGKQTPPGLWTGLAGLVVAQRAPVAILGRLLV